MATRRLLQAAGRRLGARAASDDARIVERATRGQVEMRQFGIESLGGAGMHAPHVAIFGAGFVGVNTALALLQRNIASRVTLTDVDKEKCLGEVLDLEDAGTPGSILCASPWEAGQADVIVMICAQVDAILFDRKAVLPVSVKDPTRECFLSIPTVVGVQGAETVLEIRPHLNYAEAQKYDATADTLEHMCAQLPPAGPMTRTDALDAGAARKEAYEEAA